jgi:hypothetical protein
MQVKKENAMRKHQAFPSRFLKAADLGDEPITLTIQSVTYEDLKDHDGRSRKKPVVSFTKTPKVLVINATNFDAIVDVTGQDDTDNWPGQKITVYAGEVEVNGKTYPHRSCPQARSHSHEAAGPDMDDTIPF